MHIVNVHERRIAADAALVGAVVDTLATNDDRLWPRDRWPRMRLDRPLGVGAAGGHGPVAYRCVDYVPGQRAIFEFEPKRWSRGIRGRHRFDVIADGASTILRHEIDARTSLGAALRWAFIIRPLHDALVEDALDRGEKETTGTVVRPARWSWYVRLLRRLTKKG